MQLLQQQQKITLNIDLVSRAIWSYTMLYLSTINVVFHQVNILMFYNVQITNFTIVGQKMRYTIKLCIIPNNK